MKTSRSMAMACLVFASVAACGAPELGTGAATASEPLGVGRDNRVAQVLVQHNLVSNTTDIPADNTDTNLQNAWGLAFNPAGAAWVSDNAVGLASVFNSAGGTLLTVTLPAGSAPSGQVFNGDVNSFKGDRFIIVSEDGTISGWQPVIGAQNRFTASNGAVYKGVAIATVHGALRLYVADLHNNRVDVFDADYNLLKTDNRFVDDDLPCGFAPFNIFEHDNLLYVSYALQKPPDNHDDQAGPGNGFVDVYTARGRLVHRVISRGALNSPWGMAFAPDDFGNISGDLIVGNFGDGGIHAYDLSACERDDRDDDEHSWSEWRWRWHGDRDRDRDRDRACARLDGAIGEDKHHPLLIPGLWALSFGPDAGGFSSHTLYFTAGPDDETNGIFGRLDLPTCDDH